MKNSGTPRRRVQNEGQHIVLSVCLDHVSAAVLHRLSVASKCLRAQVQAVVRQRLPQLLPGAVAACVASCRRCLAEDPNYFDHHDGLGYDKHVIDWLLQTAGRRVLNQPAAAQALLFMPQPASAGVAATAQSCGFRTSYNQVLAAAKQQVPGCGRWARCTSRLRQSQLWQVVCSYAGQQYKEDFASLLAADPEQFLDMLMLAVNCHSRSAIIMLQVMISKCKLDICDTAAVHHLLETAILRCSFYIIDNVLELPAATGLSQAQLCRLLRLALLLKEAEARIHSYSGRRTWEVELQTMVDLPGVVQELCSSSVVQQAVTSADELFPLLRVAVARGNQYGAVAALCSLKAAASRITSKQLAQLLQLGMLTGA